MQNPVFLKQIPIVVAPCFDMLQLGRCVRVAEKRDTVAKDDWRALQAQDIDLSHRQHGAGKVPPPQR